MSALGYLSLVLHAHLPFIRHPEHQDFLEEDWFFEAAVETYAPLLMSFERLRAENLKFRLTMTVTPPLASMMADPLLQSRLADYLAKRIDLLSREKETAAHPHVRYLAEHYFKNFCEVREYIFSRHGGNLIHALRGLYDSGHLEIITCTATHGFVPLLSRDSAIRAQIQTAVSSHEHFFGRRPRGIWLAECGYDPRVDEALAEADLEYFFTDSHGVLFGEPQPVDGVYAPVITAAGVNVFARDPESSKQVWSQKEGYPGDAVYREFYRDLGYDADYDYIRPYLHSDGVRRGVGIKYHRITGEVDLGGKSYYDPDVAQKRAQEHAGNFMFNRQLQIRYLSAHTRNPPIVVAPYDAELFGHWWYEGPVFIETLIRKMASEQTELEMIAGCDYLDRHPIRQLQRPNPSTWGAEGHNLVWLNGGNSWLYRQQHWAEEKMEALAARYDHPTPLEQRALNQMLRELLLLQSSDWAFILTTGTTVPYATKRFRLHLDRFRTLADQVENGRIDEGFLAHLESIDGLFPRADYRVSAPVLQHRPLLFG